MDVCLITVPQGLLKPVAHDRALDIPSVINILNIIQTDAFEHCRNMDEQKMCISHSKYLSFCPALLYVGLFNLMKLFTQKHELLTVLAHNESDKLLKVCFSTE